MKGVDINPRCVQATLINGAVYAPWIAFPFGPVERVVEVGNSLHARPQAPQPPEEPVTVEEERPDMLIDKTTGQGLLFG